MTNVIYQKPVVTLCCFYNRFYSSYSPSFTVNL